MDYVYSNEPVALAAIQTANSLREHLSKGEKVLWLLSGGSSIQVAVIASKLLNDTDLSKLFVSLTDERFGSVGHKNENWQQLINAGFNLTGANLYRPLINQDIDQTTKIFSDWLRLKLNEADYKIGIFGIGTDGHTAGIKPNSLAITTSDLATSFLGDDYQRVTISFNVIRQLDEAVIQVSGTDKVSIILRLIKETIPLEIQPAQILKSIPKATIYSNNKKEEQK